jgi:16S rRNA (adenine1518-N6/adenine1519-N6)-dimethyltransferase
MPMIRLKPKKSLGQHFLVDGNTIQKIVRTVDPDPTDRIVEIGPGSGALTVHLAGRCAELLLVEKDGRACGLLREKYEGVEGVRICHDDFLRVSLQSIVDTADPLIRIVGSIPYYITSPILMHMLDNRRYIRDAFILMQYEAARRIAARPSESDYGILSVLLQSWAAVTIRFRVPPTVFYPRPSVESALVHIEFMRSRPDIGDEILHRSIVQGTFGKRRKMLRSSLRSLFPDLPTRLDAVTIDLNKRPEQCTVGEFIQLSNELSYVLTGNREK